MRWILDTPQASCDEHTEMLLAGTREKVRRQTVGRLRRREYKHLVATVFITGLFLDILDATVVNVALPTLGRDFGAGATSLEWVVTGYLLSLAVWIPASGWVGDRFGTKKTFMFAMILFTLGSALCGQARSIEELIAFRLLQGVGGGMMTPVGIAMLFRVFPPEERAAASAFVAVPALLAPVLGPVLGGWLVDGPAWRLLFLLPLYLQNLRGMSAIQSGLTSLPQGIAMGVTLPIASRLYPRLGPRRMLAGGLTVVALTSASMVFVGLDTSLWLIRAVMLVRGAGIAFAGVAVQAAAFANVRP